MSKLSYIKNWNGILYIKKYQGLISYELLINLLFDLLIYWRDTIFIFNKKNWNLNWLVYPLIIW